MLLLTRAVNLHLDTRTRRLSPPVQSTFDFNYLPLKLWITLRGQPHRQTAMLVNVHEIDQLIYQTLSQRQVTIADAFELLRWLEMTIKNQFANCTLSRLTLDIDQTFSLSLLEEQAMIQITKKYELAASHRLWNRQWDEPRNFAVFGKCSNPRGHGHNYLVEITLRSSTDRDTGQAIDPAEMDRIILREIVERFDHKNLNEDTREFAQLIPTAENMAQVFWDILLAHFPPAALYCVRVWENPRMYAEYFGPAAGPLRFSDSV